MRDISKKTSKFKIIIIFIILVIIVIINFVPISSERIIIMKENIIYGNPKKCSGVEVITFDYARKRCKLCNRFFIASSSIRICDNCSKLTHRCDICGEIKEATLQDI